MCVVVCSLPLTLEREREIRGEARGKGCAPPFPSHPAAAAVVAFVVILFPAIKSSSLIAANSPDNDDGAAVFVRVSVPTVKSIVERSVPRGGRGVRSYPLSSSWYYYSSYY